MISISVSVLPLGFMVLLLVLGFSLYSYTWPFWGFSRKIKGSSHQVPLTWHRTGIKNYFSRAKQLLKALISSSSAPAFFFLFCFLQSCPADAVNQGFEERFMLIWGFFYDFSILRFCPKIFSSICSSSPELDLRFFCTG